MDFIHKEMIWVGYCNKEKKRKEKEEILRPVIEIALN